MDNLNQTDSIVIYQTTDGETCIDVKFQDETVWLSQAQMAELFQKDRTVIGRHINNIFKEGELEESLVCAKFAHTKDYGRREGFTQRTETTLYNLDVIISVGYRVKSKRGTQFRIWANKILKQYLLQGYAINERIASQKFDELSQLVKVLGRTIQNQEKLTEDSRSLLNVVVDYTYALDTLDRYDYQELTIEKTTPRAAFHATYENAMEVIRQLHEKFGGSRFSATRKTIRSKVPSGRYTRPSEARIFIPRLKRRQPCCFTLSPRTIPSAMATNVSLPRCSCGFSMAMASFTMKTAPSALQTIPWWRSP